MKYLLFIVAVTLSSCTILRTPSESPSIGGSTWVLTAIEQRPVSFGDKAFIKFDEEESRISGKAVCNSFFGEYERIKDKITISGIGSTKMFCEETMDEENQIITNLRKTTRYEIKLDFLYLYAGENLVLTFKK